MRETGVVRTRLGGDVEAAKTLVGVARTQLGIMKNIMALGGLQQLSRKIEFADGTVMILQSIFGQDAVSIFTQISRQEGQQVGFGVVITRVTECNFTSPDKWMAASSYDLPTLSYSRLPPDLSSSITPILNIPSADRTDGQRTMLVNMLLEHGRYSIEAVSNVTPLRVGKPVVGGVVVEEPELWLNLATGRYNPPPPFGGRYFIEYNQDSGNTVAKPVISGVISTNEQEWLYITSDTSIRGFSPAGFLPVATGESPVQIIISRGEDADTFSREDNIRFKNAPSYFWGVDTNADKTYEVMLRAEDSAKNQAQQKVSVDVRYFYNVIVEREVTARAGEASFTGAIEEAYGWLFLEVERLTRLAIANYSDPTGHEFYVFLSVRVIAYTTTVNIIGDAVRYSYWYSDGTWGSPYLHNTPASMGTNMLAAGYFVNPRTNVTQVTDAVDGITYSNDVGTEQFTLITAAWVKSYFA